VNVDYHLINMDKALDNTRKIYQMARIIRGFDYRKWIPKPQKPDGPKTDGPKTDGEDK